MLKKKNRSQVFHLTVLGKLRSFSYLQLTAQMLRAARFKVTFSKNLQTSRNITIQAPVERKDNNDFTFLSISPDASAASFIEILLQYYRLGSLFDLYQSQKVSSLFKQSDWRFSHFLKQLQLKKESSLSLSNNPDLAPCLWAAAILFRKKLRIHSTPQLHDKECDRAHALAALTTELGMEAKEFPDGFSIDASSDSSLPALLLSKKKLLDDFKDHRIAMAIGVVQFCYPGISSANPECVNKSFPDFWNCLEFLRRALP